jgi:hypothetical protein
MKIIRGDLLPKQWQDAVLSAYGYRWTTENQRRARAWYGKLGVPTMEPVSDAEWLESHSFYVTSEGTLSRRNRYALPTYKSAGVRP